MTQLNAEQKAAKRRERRQTRRQTKKGATILPATKDSESYPMLYNKERPKTYEEGIQSTASISLMELDKSGEESTFCSITCYGKRNVPLLPKGRVYDWTTEYFIPLSTLSKLGKKKVTSIDVYTRNKDKRGTLTATEKTFSLLVQRGELAISGDIPRTELAEALQDKVFYCFTTIIKTAQEPKHEHNWEVQKGIYSPTQSDPTSIYRCTACGVKLFTQASKPVPPTRGCKGA